MRRYTVVATTTLGTARTSCVESAGWTVPDYATLSESLHYFYADGPTCVMASVRATKNLKLRGVTLPIFAELHTNPYMQTAHIMGGIGVKVTK